MDNLNYTIRTLPDSEEAESIELFTNNEDDAEEAGAALAMAGFRTNVWHKDTLIHEFFPS
jgi:hypothetical protein